MTFLYYYITLGLSGELEMGPCLLQISSSELLFATLTHMVCAPGGCGPECNPCKASSLLLCVRHTS